MAVGLFFFFGKPALSDVYTLRAEKDEYNQAIQQVTDLENKKNELLAKLNSISPADQKRMETFLPTEEGIIKLVADIDGIASKHGIALSGADLSTIRTDLSRSITDAPTENVYNSKLLDISFSSSYPSLVSFLMDLENSLRVIDIRSIDLSKVPQAPNVYQYKVTAEVYWLNNTKHENQ